MISSIVHVGRMTCIFSIVLRAALLQWVGGLHLVTVSNEFNIRQIPMLTSAFHFGYNVEVLGLVPRLKVTSIPYWRTCAVTCTRSLNAICHVVCVASRGQDSSNQVSLFGGRMERDPGCICAVLWSDAYGQLSQRRTDT